MGQIAEVQAKSGHVEEAEKTAQSITNSYDTIRALGQIAEIQAKHGDFEKSKQTLLEAKNMAQSITSSYNRGDAFTYDSRGSS